MGQLSYLWIFLCSDLVTVKAVLYGMTIVSAQKIKCFVSVDVSCFPEGWEVGLGQW